MDILDMIDIGQFIKSTVSTMSIQSTESINPERLLNPELPKKEGPDVGITGNGPRHRGATTMTRLVFPAQENGVLRHVCRQPCLVHFVAVPGSDAVIIIRDHRQ